ncbi:M16 family metallopeptidase [Limimaricola variabilis]
MTRFLLVSALLALAACKEEVPIASREASPGGIEYTLLNMPGVDDVSIQLAWATDWGHRAETNKASPLIGTQLIMAGGAEGYRAGEVGELFADLNSEGYLGLAAEHHVIGDLTFERSALQETISIANAHLRAPTLDEMWFERIRDDAEQNTFELKAKPANASYDALRWAVYGDAPLRNAISLDAPGTFADLKRDEVVNWHAETITRAPEALVVAGDIEADAAGAAIDVLLKGLPHPRRAISHNTQPDFTPRRILLHLPYAQVTNLAFLAPLPPTRMGREVEDLILNHALGGDDQSVLFNAVRTGLRASYSFQSGIANYTREHRFLVLNGEVETGKLAEVERVVRDAYAGFREAGPTGSIADRKAPLVAHFSEMPDFIADQAQSELQSALDGFEAGRSLRLLEEINSVSRVSLMARLRDDFPSPDDFIVIAVSADPNALPGSCVIHTPSEAADCH